MVINHGLCFRKMANRCEEMRLEAENCKAREYCSSSVEDVRNQGIVDVSGPQNDGQKPKNNQ